MTTFFRSLSKSEIWRTRRTSKLGQPMLIFAFELVVLKSNWKHRDNPPRRTFRTLSMVSRSGAEEIYRGQWSFTTAQSAVSTNPCTEDGSLIYRSLLMLRDHYVPMKREGGLERKQTFERECRTLGIEEQPTFHGTRYGEEGETYVVRYRGRRALLDRHLKKGSAHNDQRYCFRVYFFWDDEEQHVVVGWMPSHLDTRIT